jgi:(p)ppGpp synthase/HD superfamily hydrolase
MKASHKNQFRNEWLPYYVHPLKVSFDILKNWWSYEAIIWWLLHDVIEDDKNIEINKLINLFWEDIINNVLILSKTIGNWSKINQDDYMKKIQESKIAIEIKWYDRLNNIASTYFINNEKREKYINETENIYVPFFEQHSPEIAKRIKEILKYLKTNEQPTEKELQQIKQVHDSYILINKITE